MDFLKSIEFEDADSKNAIDEIVEKASKYDIFDFIARVSGLNLLSKNQNKSVLTDTLIQHIFVNNREHYSSTVKMSDKRFNSLIQYIIE